MRGIYINVYRRLVPDYICLLYAAMMAERTVAADWQLHERFVKVALLQRLLLACMYALQVCGATAWARVEEAAHVQRDEKL